MYSEFLQMTESRLDKFCSRRDAENATNGVLKARTLANLDSAGTGPGGVLLGKKVFYQREVFLKWLDLYLKRTAHAAYLVTRKDGVKCGTTKEIQS